MRTAVGGALFRVRVAEVQRLEQYEKEQHGKDRLRKRQVKYEKYKAKESIYEI